MIGFTFSVQLSPWCLWIVWMKQTCLNKFWWQCIQDRAILAWQFACIFSLISEYASLYGNMLLTILCFVWTECLKLPPTMALLLVVQHDLSEDFRWNVIFSKKDSYFQWNKRVILLCVVNPKVMIYRSERSSVYSLLLCLLIKAFFELKFYYRRIRIIT